jgi:hypothetical protein
MTTAEPVTKKAKFISCSGITTENFFKENFKDVKFPRDGK